MRQKSPWFKPYGLRLRFALSLTISFLSCALLFCALYTASSRFMASFFDHSGFAETQIKRQGESLQRYLDENELSSQNLKLLEVWERRQPVILLELYADGKCLYTSFDEVYDRGMLDNFQTSSPDHAVDVHLTDTDAIAVLYSDFTYQYYILGTLLSALVSLAVFVLLFLRSNRKLIGYICRLNSEVQILEGGNLEYVVSVEGNDELTELARSMNQMRLAFLHQIETEQQLHQASRQLVTQMSHDLRTPLTGIMLYLEILRTHRYSSDAQLQEYLEKIDAKARSMKLISDHLFEYSLNAAPVPRTEPVSMKGALSGTIQSFADELHSRGFSVDTELTWYPCFLQTRQEYLHRIFENLLSNIEKYADASKDIVITTFDDQEFCGVCVGNRRKSTQAAVESNGVGMESVQTMMEQMNGSCTVHQTEDYFQLSLRFRKQ